MAEIVLISFPFTDTGGSKLRPALVILDTGDSDLLVARVTTQARRDSHDVEILDWQAAGLLAPSIVRLHKLATIAKSRVNRPLGSLPSSDRQRVAKVLSDLFSTW